MARVFLTGGSGFVGAALLDALHARGDHVVALARSDAAEATLRAHGAADVVRGDVLDEAALTAGMTGADIVFHVAGVNSLCPTDPQRMLDVNVKGAVTAVRAAASAGAGRFVLTSSAAALGEPHGSAGHEGVAHRGSYLSLYERSKHQGEVAALSAARDAGVDLVSVNPSSVQGPGRSGGTGRILIAYLNGTLRAFVDTQISLVDIQDCVAGHLLAAERGRTGERYVISGATLSSHQALDVISGVSGVRERVRVAPAPVASGIAATVEAAFRLGRRKPPLCREMMRTLLHGHLYDGSRATRELGLQYTPVAETFRRTIDWALAEGLIKRPLPAWNPSPESAGTPPGTR